MRKLVLLLSLLVTLAIILLGQGCQTVIEGSNSPGSSKLLGGNGEGEEGMIAYQERDLNHPCSTLQSDGNPVPNAEIVVVKSPSTTTASQTWSGCVALNPPQLINTANIQIDANGNLTYQQANYASVTSPTPVFDLNFAVNTAIPSTLSFTRSTVGTSFDASGVLVTANANAPRFDYDPVSHSLKGLLMEAAATNIVPYSQLLTSWGTNSDVTVTTDGTLAPDGTSLAFKVTEDTVAGAQSHSIDSNNFPMTLSASTNYTWSVFAKYNGRLARVSAFGLNGAYSICEFNLSAATTTPINGATCGMNQLGGGWFRLSTTFNSGSGSNAPYVYVALANVPGVTNYTGDGVSGVYLWGAQVEAGSAATSYIATTSSAASRAADSLAFNSMNWFNRTDGTLVADYIEQAGNTIPSSVFGIYGTNDATFSQNSISLSGLATTDASSVTTAGVSVFAGGGKLNSPGVVNKISLSYSATDGYAFSANGLAATTEASGSFPSVGSYAYIGSQPDGTAANRYILRAEYFAIPIPGPSLQQFTQ